MIWLLTAALAAEHVVTTTVQDAVNQAAPGDIIVLPEGDWTGAVTVDRPLTLTSRGGVLVNTVGTSLKIVAPGVVVEGLQIRGSGPELTGPDACIWIGPEGVGAVVRDSKVDACLFGIWLHEVRGARIENNVVTGLGEDTHPSEKGNGIHLFDSEELVVRGNTVIGARDGIYVSATEDSLIADNNVSEQRYGVHYMYSYRNTIRGNVANHNSGGLALMGSQHLVVTGNVATDNERQGLLFRDVQYSEIRGNRVERNGEGMFFFSSLDNVIAGNVLANNQIGARVWAGTERNEVSGNAFVANRQQVFYVSSRDQEWQPNYWSDYLGWDQDHDGHGDRPHRTETMSARLLHKYPSAVLLLGSPTLELLTHLQNRIPALRAPTISDAAPLMVWTQD